MQEPIPESCRKPFGCGAKSAEGSATIAHLSADAVHDQLQVRTRGTLTFWDGETIGFIQDQTGGIRIEGVSLGGPLREIGRASCRERVSTIV